jgi:L-ascorbate peroxidase
MAAVAPARASVALKAPNALARRDRAAATRSSDIKSSKSSSSSSRTVVVARAAGDRRSAKSIAIEPEAPSRRDVLLGGGVLATIPLLLYGSTDHSLNAVEEIPVAAALRAQTVYAGYCIPIIEKYVTASVDDLIALAIRDAGTFDAATGKGGLNGSIRFELDRPGNEKFAPAVKQLEKAKAAIDAEVGEPIGWADLIALAPAGKARYAFLRDFCGATPRFDPRWQYKAGDINIVGCDMDAMLRAPFGSSAEQIEATSWFRQNYASTGPLTGSRVHLGREDAIAADAAGMVPAEGASAEEYKDWFRRMRLSLPCLVNLAPYVDASCEATLRADPACARLFDEIDRKKYQPGNLEKPLIKNYREMTLRGPAERADIRKYVVVEPNGEILPAVPKVNGKTMKNVKELMTEYTDPFPVWMM